MDLTRRAFVKVAMAGAALLPLGCLTKPAQRCYSPPAYVAPRPGCLLRPPESFIHGRKLVRVEWLDVEIEELKVHERRMRGGYYSAYYYNAVGRLALRRPPRRLWGVDSDPSAGPGCRARQLRGPKEVEFYRLGGGRILILLEQWGNRVPDLYA